MWYLGPHVGSHQQSVSGTRAANYHRLQWKVYATHKTNLISFSVGVQFKDGHHADQWGVWAQRWPSDPERLCLKTAHYCLEGFLLIQMESVTPFEWFIRSQTFTSGFCACYDGFGPADSSPGNWCRSPGNSKKNKKLNAQHEVIEPRSLKKWQFSIVNMLLDFFLIPVSPHHAGSCGILPSLYTKRSCLRQHSKESSAVKVTRLLWHYCAAQMQGFSIFLTAWQTHSNP